jgi:hypothetical protein
MVALIRFLSSGSLLTSRATPSATAVPIGLLSRGVRKLSRQVIKLISWFSGSGCPCALENQCRPLSRARSKSDSFAGLAALVGRRDWRAVTESEAEHALRG